MIRNILLGIENLLLHKLRSFLTIIGVVFGVGSVVSMLSIGEGASKEALMRIKKLGSNNIIITAEKSIEEEEATKTTTFLSIYGLTYDDHARLEETFDTIEKTVPVKLIRKTGYIRNRSLELRVVGTTPTWFELVKRDIIAGRTLILSDEEKQAPVAVLTEYGARRLLATDHTIGKFLRISGNAFKIIGIIKNEEAGGTGLRIPDRNVDAYIPLSTAKNYFGDIIFRRTSGSSEREMVELHQIIVSVDKLENVEKTANAITYMFNRFHKQKDYNIQIPLALLQQAEATKRTFNIVLGSIACISLLVGGIGIMNIMLASVTERTREIGIRRAIGARKNQIIIQFLIETIVLSTSGGIIGIALGVFVPLIITQASGMPTVITVKTILMPFIISVATGIVFGIFPAAKAASMDPVIALRNE